MATATEGSMTAAWVHAGQAAVETSLSLFEALSPDDRLAIRQMLCEFFDTDDSRARQEIVVSILECLSPPGYINVRESATLEEWIDSDAKTKRAMQQLTAKKQSFAKKVAELISERGLTQAELAKRLEVTQPSVAALLKGQHKPQPKTLKRLAVALGVTTKELWPNDA